MKKAYIYITLSFISCTTPNKIYYTKNVNKCIHNLNEMQKWLQQDYKNGDIPRYVADNYMIVIINTKCSLYKKIKEKHIDCTN